MNDPKYTKREPSAEQLRDREAKRDEFQRRAAHSEGKKRTYWDTRAQSLPIKKDGKK